MMRIPLNDLFIYSINSKETKNKCDNCNENKECKIPVYPHKEFTCSVKCLIQFIIKMQLKGKISYAKCLSEQYKYTPWYFHSDLIILNEEK